MGYTETECKQFDEVVVDFWDWFENKREETVLRKTPKQKQGWSPQKKYQSEDQILAEYYADRADRRPTDPIADAMTDDDIRDLVNDVITG